MELTLSLSDAQLEDLARRVAALLEPRATPPWIDVSEAARALGYSNGDWKRGKARVYDLAARGQIQTTKDGRRLLVSRASLNAYLALGT